MNLKRKIALAVVLCLAMTMTGCSSDTAVYVQSVKSLASLGGIAPGDRFAGMVVSEFEFADILKPLCIRIAGNSLHIFHT